MCQPLPGPGAGCKGTPREALRPSTIGPIVQALAGAASAGAAAPSRATAMSEDRSIMASSYGGGACWGMNRDEGQAFAMSRIFAHSASRTGATDSRDWRISSILARLGSALIAASVTGFASGRTGATLTDTQAGSLGSGAGPRTTRMIPTTALSAMLW